VGEFNNGRRDGIGILKDDKGRIIKGFYKKGVLSGAAFVDVYRSRYRYVGGFEKGLFEGVGEEVHDRVKYFGHFEKGKKHGIGFLKSGSSGESFMQSEQHSKLKLTKTQDGFNDARSGKANFWATGSTMSETDSESRYLITTIFTKAISVTTRGRGSGGTSTRAQATSMSASFPRAREWASGSSKESR